MHCGEGSVVLKKGIEEPWPSERVARFIDSLAFKEITLKSDRAGNNRVQKSCSSELQRRGYAGGCSPRRQAFKRIRRKRSCCTVSSEPCMKCIVQSLHTRRTPRRLPRFCCGWWNMRGAFCPGARRVETGRTPLERLHGKKPTQEFVPFGEKVLARPICSETLNRMNPRYQYGVWLGVRNKSAESRGELMASGLLTDRRLKLTLCHHHQCRLRELECKGIESREQTLLLRLQCDQIWKASTSSLRPLPRQD